jgi:hypothetical protein
MIDAASVRRVDAASSWRNFFRRPPVWAQRMDATVVPEDPDARPHQAIVDSLFEPPHPEEYGFRAE